MNINIHFRDDAVRELYGAAGVQTSGSAGFDLVCVEDVVFEGFGEFKLIDLGVVIQSPKGHHSLLMPRSSTFKKFGIIQANSVGLIDEDYCGKDDIWRFPAIYMRPEPIKIKAGTRIAQFILQKTVAIDSVSHFSPEDQSRGGFGSTGHL